MSSTTAMPRISRRMTVRIAVESYEKVDGNHKEEAQFKRSLFVDGLGHTICYLFKYGKLQIRPR